ncbi:hypothetical protein [Chroococcidiopsis sp.]|uniref:hypothetical protein n=1 Tax=Chroococcidiopsis sp. TaxID=3088168 RepID=UPI003F33C94C
MRHVNDFYPTEDNISLELLDRVPEIAIAKLILEPCTGNGAIADVLYRRTTSEVVCFDINPDFGYAVADATKTEFWKSLDFQLQGDRPDWVITNPPFSSAHLIVPQAFDAALAGIAMLLPTSWLQPAKGRGEWLEAHEGHISNLIIFGEPRPSFTGDGKTAMCTVVWVVWKKELQLGCQVHFARNWNKK